MERDSKAYHYTEALGRLGFSVGLSHGMDDVVRNDEGESPIGFHVHAAAMGSTTPLRIMLAGNNSRPSKLGGPHPPEYRYVTIAEALNMINALHAGIREAMSGDKDE
jgi:hypothetical protein